MTENSIRPKVDEVIGKGVVDCAKDRALGQGLIERISYLRRGELMTPLLNGGSKNAA